MIFSLPGKQNYHPYFCTDARIDAVMGVTRRSAEKVQRSFKIQPPEGFCELQRSQAHVRWVTALGGTTEG